MLLFGAWLVGRSIALKHGVAWTRMCRRCHDSGGFGFVSGVHARLLLLASVYASIASNEDVMYAAGVGKH